MPMVHTTTQPSRDDSFQPLLTHGRENNTEKASETSSCEPASSDSVGELLPASATQAKAKAVTLSHDLIHPNGFQQQFYLENKDINIDNNNVDNQGLDIDQGLTFEACCRSLQRPDSPTSLEDSQSDSGLDTFAIDALDKEQSMTRFRVEAVPLSKLNMSDRIHSTTTSAQQELINGNSPLSPSQVATPPLSPIKPPAHTKSGGGNEPDSLEGDGDGCKENGVKGVLADQQDPATLELSTSMEINMTQQVLGEVLEEERTCTTVWGSEALLPSLHEDSSSESVVYTDETLSKAEASTSATSVPPKVSAWSTLLPGVAPIPQPKPTTRPSAIQRSEQARLHERFPIVLPHESQVKLSMEMVDLFEVRLAE